MRNIVIRFLYLFGLGFAVQLICLPAVLADEDSIRAAIEKKEKSCCDKDGSTAGTTECAEKAYLEWDKELNNNYNALMKKLSNEGKASLKLSQQSWLQFRDKEFKTLDAIYSKMEGTMYVPMSVESRIRIVRDRALELLADYRLVAGDEDPPRPSATHAKLKKR